MAFPAVKAVSGAVEQTAYLATDVVQGTRYAGLIYKDAMRSAYKAQQAEGFNEQNAVDQSSWSDVQKAQYALDI